MAGAGSPGDSTTMRKSSGRSTATVSAITPGCAESSNRMVTVAAGSPADSRRLRATAGEGGWKSTWKARGRVFRGAGAAGDDALASSPASPSICRGR